MTLLSLEDTLIDLSRTIRAAVAALALASVGVCSQAGSLGSVLGSVLGGGGQQQGRQVTGIVRQVDTRNQQLALQQSNGQTIALVYDNRTKVVYQNREYTVANLENGDQVTARVQQTQNGSYYTDLVQVDQSVSTSTGSSSTNSGQVQSLQGVVRRVDTANGWFQIDGGNNVLLTVYMPYNPSRTDLQKFQNLRNGDTARFTGVFVNQTRVDLRQFY